MSTSKKEIEIEIEIEAGSVEELFGFAEQIRVAYMKHLNRFLDRGMPKDDRIITIDLLKIAATMQQTAMLELMLEEVSTCIANAAK